MPPPHPSSEHQASSSQPPASNGGIRIAGIASRTPSAASSSVAPSPASQPAKEPPRSPVKLDRERHASHRAPIKPPQASSIPSRHAKSDSRQWPERPAPTQNSSGHRTSAPSSRGADDDEDEEGAIDDTSASKTGPKSPPRPVTRPPPPKTPPHRSNAAAPSGAPRGNDRDRERHSNQSNSYQPRSPSPPRRPQPPSSSSSFNAHGSHLRSPSPAASSGRRTSKDFDDRAHKSRTDERQHHRQQPDRWEPDRYRHGDDKGVPSRSHEQRGRDSRQPRPSAQGWDQTFEDPTHGWDDDWRGERDRAWDHERRGGDREWGRERDRQVERLERQRGWEPDRYTEHRGEQSRSRPHDRPNDRNGRDREMSPPTATAKDQGFSRWSPTPPRAKPDNHSSDAASNGDAFASRPPSRMGRTAPPPPLLSHPERPPSSNASRDFDSSAVKRPRSRSPPAGLLKRKANFNAVVPPALAAVNPTDGGSSDNVAPGAPLPPKVETMQSPVLPASRLGSESVVTTALPGSHPGSALPSTAASAVAAASTSAAAAATAADANYNATCEALDDPTLPAVRLSCLPRKLPSAPQLSGRERRKARQPLPPLNQRKFYGCSSLDDYEISIKLGQGTFGEVLKGRQILTGTQVALKKVTIHDAKDGLPITALREIKLLKKLQHPSIVPVIDMAFRPSGERGKLGDVYMVEPYMDHDLNGMLENPSIRLEHSQIKLYMKQLLEGTLYLHKNRILHRDMKAANLLINNKGQLQIADFGLARPYRDPGQSWTGKGWQGGTHRYTNMVVTRWYRPPELLAGEKKYGPPIDMWGIGCILAEMIMGRPLFKGTSEINQLELIAKLCGSPNEASFPGWSSLPGVKDADPMGRPDPHPEVPGQHGFGEWPRRIKEFFTSFPYDAGQGCADLIDKLLVLDPKRRLTAQQALEHEWFWSKPYPADPGSLPVYEHSKEIDRVRREWKPQPQVAVGAASVGASVPVNVGRSGQQQGYGVGGGGGQQQQRFARPTVVGGGGGGYAHPNGAGGGQAMSNVADGWEQPILPPSGPGVRAVSAGAGAQGAPIAPGGGVGGHRAYPGGGGGGGRHAFPQPQSQPRPPVRPPPGTGPGGGGARFPHPNSAGRHAYPSQRPYPPQHQQHGLPPRPPAAGSNGFRGAGNGGAGGGGAGGGANPYSF